MSQLGDAHRMEENEGNLEQFRLRPPPGYHYNVTNPKAGAAQHNIQPNQPVSSLQGLIQLYKDCSNAYQGSLANPQNLPHSEFFPNHIGQPQLACLNESILTQNSLGVGSFASSLVGSQPSPAIFMHPTPVTTYPDEHHQSKYRDISVEGTINATRVPISSSNVPSQAYTMQRNENSSGQFLQNTTSTNTREHQVWWPPSKMVPKNVKYINHVDNPITIDCDGDESDVKQLPEKEKEIILIDDEMDVDDINVKTTPMNAANIIRILNMTSESKTKLNFETDARPRYSYSLQNDQIDLDPDDPPSISERREVNPEDVTIQGRQQTEHVAKSVPSVRPVEQALSNQTVCSLSFEECLECARNNTALTAALNNHNALTAATNINSSPTVAESNRVFTTATINSCRPVTAKNNCVFTSATINSSRPVTAAENNRVFTAATINSCRPVTAATINSSRPVTAAENNRVFTAATINSSRPVTAAENNHVFTAATINSSRPVTTATINSSRPVTAAENNRVFTAATINSSRPVTTATINSSRPVTAAENNHVFTAATINSSRPVTAATINSSRPVTAAENNCVFTAATINSSRPVTAAENNRVFTAATINSSRPVTAATINSSRPVTTATINSSRPVTAATINSSRPVTTATINSSRPVTTATINSSRPVTAATINSSRPVTAAENNCVFTAATINSSRPVIAAENNRVFTAATINSSRPVTTATINSSRPVIAAENNSVFTAATINSSRPVTAATINSSRPVTAAETINSSFPAAININSSLTAVENIGSPFFTTKNLSSLPTAAETINSPFPTAININSLPATVENVNSSLNADTPQSEMDGAGSTSGIVLLEAFSLQPELETLECGSDSSEHRSRESQQSTQNKLKKAFFKCGLNDCTFNTIMPVELEVHQLQAHHGSSSFVCVHCGYVARTPAHLTEHLHSHVSKAGDLGQFDGHCNYSSCSYKPVTSKDLINHIAQNHYTSTSHQCFICKKDFASSFKLINHFKQNILNVVKCPHCSAKCVTKTNILKHLTLNHPECGRFFNVCQYVLCKERKKHNWPYNSETEISTPSSEPHYQSSMLSLSQQKQQQLEEELKCAGLQTRSVNVPAETNLLKATEKKVNNLHQPRKESNLLEMKSLGNTETGSDISNSESLQSDVEMSREQVKKNSNGKRASCSKAKGQKKKMMRCKECNLVTSNCGLMYKHVRREHNITDMVICEVCKIPLPVNRMMEHHAQYHIDGDEDYIPTALGKSFETFWVDEEKSSESGQSSKKRSKKFSFKKKPVLERNIVEKIIGSDFDDNDGSSEDSMLDAGTDGGLVNMASQDFTQLASSSVLTNNIEVNLTEKLMVMKDRKRKIEESGDPKENKKIKYPDCDDLESRTSVPWTEGETSHQEKSVCVNEIKTNPEEVNLLCLKENATNSQEKSVCQKEKEINSQNKNFERLEDNTFNPQEEKSACLQKNTIRSLEKKLECFTENTTKSPKEKSVSLKENPIQLNQEKSVSLKENTTISQDEKSVLFKKNTTNSLEENLVCFKENTTKSPKEKYVSLKENTTISQDEKSVLFKKNTTNSLEENLVCFKENTTKSPKEKSVHLKENTIQLKQEKSVSLKENTTISQDEKSVLFKKNTTNSLEENLVCFKENTTKSLEGNPIQLNEEIFVCTNTNNSQNIGLNENATKSPEGISVYHKENKTKSAEGIFVYCKENTTKSPERISVYHRENTTKSPEGISVYRRENTTKSPERISVYRKENATKSPEGISVYRKENTTKSPEGISVCLKENTTKIKEEKTVCLKKNTHLVVKLKNTDLKIPFFQENRSQSPVSKKDVKILLPTEKKIKSPVAKKDKKICFPTEHKSKSPVAKKDKKKCFPTEQKIKSPVAKKDKKICLPTELKSKLPVAKKDKKICLPTEQKIKSPVAKKEVKILLPTEKKIKSPVAKKDTKVSLPSNKNTLPVTMKANLHPPAFEKNVKYVGLKEEDCPDEFQFLHPDFEFRCKYCTHRQGSFHTFIHHMYYHFHYKKYGCGYCSFEGFSENRIVTHIGQEHPERVKKPNIKIKIDPKREKRFLDLCHFCFVPKSKDDVELRERLEKKKLKRQSVVKEKKEPKKNVKKELIKKIHVKKELIKKVHAKKEVIKKVVGKKVSVIKKLKITSIKKGKPLTKPSPKGRKPVNGTCFLCPYCRENGQLLSWIRLHIEICYHIHYKPLKCGYCSELETASMLRLIKHTDKEHPGKEVNYIPHLDDFKEQRLKELVNRSVKLSRRYMKEKSDQLLVKQKDWWLSGTQTSPKVSTNEATSASFTGNKDNITLTMLKTLKVNIVRLNETNYPYMVQKEETVSSDISELTNLTHVKQETLSSPVESTESSVTSNLPSDTPDLTSDTTDHPSDTTDHSSDSMDTLVTRDLPSNTPDLPSVTTNHPSVTTDNPSVTPDLPSDLPSVTTDFPSVTIDHPSDTTDLPSVTSDNHSDITDHPSINSNFHSDTSGHSLVTTDHPLDTTDLPSVTTDLPSVPPHNTLVTRDLPSVTPHDTLETTDLPSVSPHDTLVTTDLPSITLHDTLVTTDLPSVTPHNTLVTRDLPSVTPHDTLVTTDLPSITPHDTLVTTDLPSVTPHNILVTRDLPSVTPRDTLVTTDLPLVTPHDTLVTTDVPSITPHDTLVTTDVPSVTPHDTLVTTDVPSITPGFHPPISSDLHTFASVNNSVTPDIISVTPNRPSVAPNLQSVAPVHPTVSRDRPSHQLKTYRIYKSSQLFTTVKDNYGDPVFQCIKCEYTIRNLKSMYSHSYKHQPQIFHCGYCDYKAFPRSQTMWHLKTTHRGKPPKVIDIRQKVQD